MHLFGQYNEYVKKKLTQIDSLYGIDEELTIQISNELAEYATVLAPIKQEHYFKID